MDTEAVEKGFDEGSPHESLYLVIAYLPLYELLVMSQVCRSLRDAVNNDILPWLEIVVREPLSKSFSDDHLIKVTSKANGRLTMLALYNCSKISDYGLLQVAGCNPLITTLCVPACTALTPSGIIEAVKLLSQNNDKLKTLMISGIHNMKIEHLEMLIDLVDHDQNNERLKKKGSNFYHAFKIHQIHKRVENIGPLDVDLCPKCHEVRLVFDCPRESCRKMREHKQMECRGCSICITRCEECGVCTNKLDDEEGEETACGETLCLDCWLHLPKCSFCNKSYCNQHSYQRCFLPASTGWICLACKTNFTEIHSA